MKTNDETIILWNLTVVTFFAWVTAVEGWSLTWWLAGFGMLLAKD